MKQIQPIKWVLIIGAIFFFLFAYTNLLYQVTQSDLVEFLMLMSGFGGFVALFSALIFSIMKLFEAKK